MEEAGHMELSQHDRRNQKLCIKLGASVTAKILKDRARKNLTTNQKNCRIKKKFLYENLVHAYSHIANQDIKNNNYIKNGF